MDRKYFYDIEDKFLDYFEDKVKQVFLYVTDKCDLRCKQCLYKPNLTFHMKHHELPLETCKNMISDFKKMGANKLTIMGGEPSLYGDEAHLNLGELIRYSKEEIGYKYVRMDTNGQFKKGFLEAKYMDLLDEISFSIDGYNAETHDILRGEGSFEKAINNFKLAKKLGFNLDVTTCGHRALLKEDALGINGFEQMFRFAEELGVQRLNFHVLFKHGFPMDTWTEETDLKYNEWIPIYNDLLKKMNQGKYKIEIRLPQHFVDPKTFNKKPAYYGYCAAKLGERILIHPDGMLRICSGLISSKYGVGKFYENKIVLDHGLTNELLGHDLNCHTPCTNQNKTMETGEYYPLCFSFKPNQSEIVWKDEINWEEKRKLSS